MICEIAHVVHPDGAGRRVMAILTFKFDESYKDNRSLMVGGWIADDKQWKRVESRWQKAIALENKTLAPEHRIKRYHAAEMNAGDGPFKGWEKWRRNRFTDKLLRILSNGQMTAVGCGMDLRAFDELFPRRMPPDYGIAYIMCMGTIMHAIADAAKGYPPDFRIALVHDHGDWDAHALAGYNDWVDDHSWEDRHRFVRITPLTWREDVGLQAADLIAYETMRWLDNELWVGDDRMRYALRKLVSNDVHIYGVYHSKDALKDVARLFEERHGYKSGLSGIQELQQGDD